MDELDLEILEALQETQNITKASLALYMTQSALSKRVTALENQLGASLVVRTRRGIHLTPEGEMAVKSARRISGEIAQLKSDLASVKGHISGTLNAGITNNYAQVYLGSLLNRFTRQYPDVTTNIRTGHSRNIFSLLNEGKIDVAIVRGEYRWNEYTLLLSQENLCAARSPFYENQPLQKIPYIARITDVTLESEIAQWLREQSIFPPAKGLRVDNILTCLSLVNEGLGWAALPQLVLKDFKGTAEPMILRNGRPILRSTYLICPYSLSQLPQVEAFIQVARSFHQQPNQIPG